MGTLHECSEKNVKEYEAQITCHGVIRLWIQCSVSKKIASQVMYTNDPIIIWANLRDQFKQSNETHVYQLSHDATVTCKRADSVSTFYIKQKTFQRELDAYGEVQHCDCGKCSFNVNGRINDKEVRFKIRKFLMDLNDQLRQVRSHILSLETLPKLNKVYTIVSQEETQQQLKAPQQIASAHAYYSSKASTPKNTTPHATSTHVGKLQGSLHLPQSPPKRGLLHPLGHFITKVEDKRTQSIIVLQK